MTNVGGIEAVSESQKKRLEKVLVISQSSASHLYPILLGYNFRIVEKDPDFIICYGGDGTVLFSERTFPQIPKLIVKKSNVSRKCDYPFQNIGGILHKVRAGEYQIKEEMKLETEFIDEKLVGLNEIQLHNKQPIYAIRFSLSVNQKEFSGLIGDGAIFATPFGSTGYYQSTGGKDFQKGIGVSFNNLHNLHLASFVVPEDSVISVKIDRGPALVLADNNERFFELKNHDVFTVKKSTSIANLIYVST